MDEEVPDGALYEGLRLGSGRALRLLADRHDAAMRRVAALYVDDDRAVDALVLHTWATALPGLDMFTWHCSFRAWLFGILVTAGRGAHRSRPHDDDGTVPPPPPREMDVPADVPWATLPWSRYGDDAVAAAAACVRAMPTAEREVLWFLHVEGWPPREACDALGLTAEEFGGLAARATDRLVRTVAARLSTPPPAGGDRDAAVRALVPTVGAEPGATPGTAVLRVLRAWRADRGLTVWHRLRARRRLRTG